MGAGTGEGQMKKSGKRQQPRKIGEKDDSTDTGRGATGNRGAATQTDQLSMVLQYLRRLPNTRGAVLLLQ